MKITIEIDNAGILVDLARRFIELAEEKEKTKAEPKAEGPGIAVSTTPALISASPQYPAATGPVLVASPTPVPLTAVPVATDSAGLGVKAVPTAAPSYTRDDLARASASLMDQGRQMELQQLLAKYGVRMLPELPEAFYGAFAADLRAMGAAV